MDDGEVVSPGGSAKTGEAGEGGDRNIFGYSKLAISDWGGGSSTRNPHSDLKQDPCRFCLTRHYFRVGPLRWCRCGNIEPRLIGPPSDFRES
jgi:hypothetical protein